MKFFSSELKLLTRCAGDLLKDYESKKYEIEFGELAYFKHTLEKPYSIRTETELLCEGKPRGNLVVIGLLRDEATAKEPRGKGGTWAECFIPLGSIGGSRRIYPNITSLEEIGYENGTTKEIKLWDLYPSFETYMDVLNRDLKLDPQIL